MRKMKTNTNPFEPDDKYDIRSNIDPYGNTDIDIIDGTTFTPPQSKHEIEIDKTVEKNVYSGNIYSLKTITTEEKIKDEKLSEQEYKNDVNGSVLRVEDVSVICELYLNEESVEINLPRSFFPDNVYYGVPINLSIDESSGFRTPVIKIRQVSEDTKNISKEEMEDLINKL